MSDRVTCKPKCCIVYTTDQGYFFPTLVSAVQARIHASPAIADVMILSFGLDAETELLFRTICDEEKVLLVSFSSASINNQTAMMARLFLSTLMPEQYEEWLYLDGDIQIHGSLDPLLEAVVPEGHFLAANDPFTFLLADSSVQSRNLRRHLRSLGLNDEQGTTYFNSGVLRIRRTGWDAVCHRALEYIARSSKSSRFPDQDALNVVAAQQRLPMSLTWNYPVFLRNSRVESSIRPRIVHFMSSPKPWQGVFPPWTSAASQPYFDVLDRYPALVPFSGAMGLCSRMVYHMQQRAKQLTENITWGWSKRRGRVLAYERACLKLGAP